MVRRTVIPWKGLPELIGILEAERDLLQQQIEALKAVDEEAANSTAAAVLICRYLIYGNAKSAADWVNHLGYRTPGGTRNGTQPAMPRKFSPNDVYEYLRDPPPTLPPPILALARRAYGY